MKQEASRTLLVAWFVKVSCSCYFSVLIVQTKDRGDLLLRNVCWVSLDHYPRRKDSSLTTAVESQILNAWREWHSPRCTAPHKLHDSWVQCHVRDRKFRPIHDRNFNLYAFHNSIYEQMKRVAFWMSKCLDRCNEKEKYRSSRNKTESVSEPRTSLF
jgi:hypothetical protein